MAEIFAIQKLVKEHYNEKCKQNLGVWEKKPQQRILR